jgi:hypothetical protein
VIYNDLSDLEESIRSLNPSLLQKFDSSCFNGNYVTPEVTPELVRAVEDSRGNGRRSASFSLSNGDGSGKGKGKGRDDPKVIDILVHESEEDLIVTPLMSASSSQSLPPAAPALSSMRSCESIQNLNPDLNPSKRIRTSDL